MVNERLVDLQPGDRKALKRTEARIAGSEVVDRELNAQTLQFLHRGDRLFDVLHDQALGQLQLEIFGLQATVLQSADDAGHQVPVSYTHLRAHETRHDL